VGLTGWPGAGLGKKQPEARLFWGAKRGLDGSPRRGKRAKGERRGTI
jgi:hypothetical protein